MWYVTKKSLDPRSFFTQRQHQQPHPKKPKRAPHKPLTDGKMHDVSIDSHQQRDLAPEIKILVKTGLPIFQKPQHHHHQ